MQALSPSTPNNHTRPSLARRMRRQPVTTVRVVRCIYRSDPVNFPNGIGSNRADWQSSCAILNARSNNISQEDQPTEGGRADHVAAVNGHTSAVDLNLVPIDASKGSSPVAPQPPKPLTITDLSPAPMHGSQLRVAYQGIPGA
ncbi:hypothetical protein SAY86_026307 [Trapa natans]|uniref:Uncharacterized protein n=1 Tax=Trapa natans TaxID=22666 RepID=A0AAN7KLH9_TRANT|nr:hypothetical protein SAY86_026307 [Trapa natans]